MATAPSPRILELLALAEESPDLAVLRPYLTDADAAVRAAAVGAVTETVPAGAGPALAASLSDPEPAVRAAAAGSLRELLEVLPGDPQLGAVPRAALPVADPVVRAAALEALRVRRLGDALLYAEFLADPDPEIRTHGVRALVSVDAVPALARAAADPAREVRVAVTKGLAAVHAPAPAPLDPLPADTDPLARAAALAATDCPEDYAHGRRRPHGPRPAGPRGRGGGPARTWTRTPPYPHWRRP
ncbi:HEAT repeat domain-containing protein [Streptomyces sp. NPDC086989]|uniref:HEAT repeat domain-containing protein n=1 Tax=Streptomyces sp. NPDC086989 TaxID=3365764 RepID=UPI0037F3E016